MTPLQSVERELAANAASLRALARDLVGRDHADDLVQETALRALRSPPAQPAGLGSWFATILRRLAGNHRRADRRRQQREQAAAVSESQPAVDDTLARRESLRKVTLALLAMPEPYQTTLLQRYFEGLSPGAIARRAGVPVATVKSRLQRGLAQLRDVLDRRDRRTWRPALALATGLATPATTFTLIGTLLMANSAKLTVGAAGLLAALFVWWQLDSSAATPPPPAAAPPVAAADTSPAPASELPPAEPLPREVATEADKVTLGGLEHPFGYLLRCRVVDRDGLPVEGARLAMAPPGCAMNRWPERTAADGTATLHWRSRLTRLRMTIGVVGDDLAQGLRQLDLEAGVDAGLVLLGETQRRNYRLVSSQKAGEALSFVLVAAGCPGQGGETAQDCRTCHADTPFVRGLFDNRLEVRAGLHPDATFADLLLPKAPQPANTGVELRAAVRTLTGRLDNVSVEIVSGKLRVEGGASAPASGTVTGTVFGEDGKPVAGATVIWSTVPDQPRNRARTGKDGTFRLEEVPAGQVEVRAGGRDGGIGRALVQVAAGVETPASVHLRRGATIRGRATGKDGAPLEGWRVEYEGLDVPWNDTAVVQKSGAFELPNLPGGAGRLLLWPKDQPKLPVAIEPSALPDSGEILFDLGKLGEPAGGLRLRCHVPAELGPIHAEVRVFQQDTGRGAPMAQTKDGAFVLERLREGFYRLEVGAESVGWIDLGQQWVAGGGLTDLGTVRAAEPATLRVTSQTPGKPFELYQRRGDGDVRVAPDVGAEGELRLPAGRWLALWRDADGVLHRREFALESGRGHALDLTAGPR